MTFFSSDDLKNKGFSVVEGVVSDDEYKHLAKILEMNASKGLGKNLMPSDFIKDLVSNNRFSEVLSRLFSGGRFHFHHANGRCTADGTGKRWHHDYDTKGLYSPKGPKMFHFMIYPMGLPRSVAPLVLRPGTHHIVSPRTVDVETPFEVAEEDFVANFEKPVTIILHSGLWHMRPEGGDALRYDMNVSFCEKISDESHVWPERNAVKKAYSKYSLESEIFS